MSAGNIESKYDKPFPWERRGGPGQEQTTEPAWNAEHIVRRQFRPGELEQLTADIRRQPRLVRSVHDSIGLYVGATRENERIGASAIERLEAHMATDEHTPRLIQQLSDVGDMNHARMLASNVRWAATTARQLTTQGISLA